MSGRILSAILLSLLLAGVTGALIILLDEAPQDERVDPELMTKLTLQPEKPVRMYVSLSDNRTAEELESKGVKILRSGKYVNYAVVEGNLSTLNALLETPGVQKIMEDGVVRVAETSALLPDPFVQSIGWNLEAIRADAAHENNFTGEGAVIVILDTGVNHNLEDLNENYLGGYDVIGDDNEPEDVYGHGTKSAAIAVGEGDGKYTGVAPGAGYYAVKVLNDEGWGNWSDVISGLEWVYEQVQSGKRIDVVSMSFGASSAPLELEDICRRLYSSGVVLVGASGNEGASSSIFPAAYSFVISVAAVDSTGYVAGFSNGGALVAAPGVQVPVLDPEGMLSYGDGTSFAAPHVSGAIALVMAEKRLSPEQILELLENSTVTIEDPEDKVELGKVDAVLMISNGLNMQIKDGERWYDIINETPVRILLGLFILVVFMKFYSRREVM